MTHLIDLDKLIEYFHKEADRCAQNARSPPKNTVSSSVWEDRSVLYATLAEDLEYMADHLAPDKKEESIWRFTILKASEHNIPRPSPDEKAIRRPHSSPWKEWVIEISSIADLIALARRQATEFSSDLILRFSDEVTQDGDAGQIEVYDDYVD